MLASARQLAAQLLMAWPVYLCATITLAVTISAPAAAERRMEIFSDTSLVLDQSVSVRQQAMKASLKTVLVRATGDVDIAEQPAIATALSAPSAYVSQYRYANTDEVITIAGAARPAQQLFLQFSKPAVERLLKTAQIAMWRELRPEVLLWVAIDDQGKRIADTNSTAVTAMRRAASIRGIPLAVPSLDLTDRQSLSASRLWARDEVAIDRASQRYGADGVLAGRVIMSGQALRANFLLTYNQRKYDFSAESDSLTALMQNIIDQAMVALAQPNSVILSDNNRLPSLTVAIGNVSRFASYAEVLQRLTALPSVSEASLQEVNQGYLLVNLRYQTTQDRIRSQLSQMQGFESIPKELFVGTYLQPPVSDVDREDEPEVSVSDTDSFAKPAPLLPLPRIDLAFEWNGDE